MKRPAYTIVVEPDERGWLASIPALPVCYAPSDTVEEALRELQVAYEMILEEFVEEGPPTLRAS
ncbi:MAG: type II toxin-antitoxin system HicB family antitoxin [Chloroflexota bacterium]